jgi:hypothetical protein
MFLNNLQEARALKTNRARNQDIAMYVDSRSRNVNATSHVRHAKQIRYNYM